MSCVVQAEFLEWMQVVIPHEGPSSELSAPEAGRACLKLHRVLLSWTDLAGFEAARLSMKALLEGRKDQAGCDLRARILAGQHNQVELQAGHSGRAVLERLLPDLQVLLHASKQRSLGIL